MRAMTEYLAETLPIVEYMLEEFRLSVKAHANELKDSLDLYSLDSSILKEKLGMTGLEATFLEEGFNPSAQFYKLFKRLIRNRSTKGALQTLARTGGQLESSYRNLKDINHYTGLRIYRDYEAPHIGARDGYFYMVSNPSYPISSNAFITNALPAGYCFLSVTEFYGFNTQKIFSFCHLVGRKALYISSFVKNPGNPSEPVREDLIIEALHASNVKGIMPQYDQGWSFGGLAIRNKTFGDLFRERNIRVKPRNASWTDLLNHAGDGKINSVQHEDLWFVTKHVEESGLIITDSLQYHKDLIISERQEFTVMHERIESP